MEILYGSYDDSVVHHIADRIIHSIEMAARNPIPATIATGTIPVRDAVRNRLIDDGPIDSLLRVISINRSDSSKLLMMNFTAHATCLFSRDLELSRDYPGTLVDQIEASGYDFAMFMAGAVGSHSASVQEQGRPCIDEINAKLSAALTTIGASLDTMNDGTLWMKRVPLLLTHPQAKIFHIGA